VTVTFTVITTGGTPAGNVTVSDGRSCIGTVAAGTCTLTPTTAARRRLPPSYAGNTNFAAGTFGRRGAQRRGRQHATRPSRRYAGSVGRWQGITVTFTVTSAGGTPTGNVTVSDGGGDLHRNGCYGNLHPHADNGGAKTLTATYAGDGNFGGGSSAGVPHTVNAAATTTTITAHTPDPSATAQAVSFTFSVAATAPGSGTPAGTVSVD